MFLVASSLFSLFDTYVILLRVPVANTSYFYMSCHIMHSEAGRLQGRGGASEIRLSGAPRRAVPPALRTHFDVEMLAPHMHCVHLSRYYC
jgi:hypothetical protein